MWAHTLKAQVLQDGGSMTGVAHLSTVIFFSVQSSMSLMTGVGHLSTVIFFSCGQQYEDHDQCGAIKHPSCLLLGVSSIVQSLCAGICIGMCV